MIADIDLERLAPGAHAAHELRRRRAGVEHAAGCAPRIARSSSSCPTTADAAAPARRALPVRPDRPRARRALLRGLQHPGEGLDEAPAGDGIAQDRHRGLGRPGLDARPHRRGHAPWTGSAGRAGDIMAYTMPGFATSDHTSGNAHALDAGARRDRRARSTSGPRARQMFKDIGHPFARGEQYDVTFENVQAGERTSHLFRLRQPAPGRSCSARRPLGARARMGHLRRRRPHVALQRQLLGAQDADPAPDPLGDRDAAVRRAGARDPRVGARHGDLAGARSGKARRRQGPGPEHRSRHRALRAAGLQPLLHEPLRLPPEPRGLSRPQGLGRPRKGSWPAGRRPRRAPLVRPGRRSASGWRCSSSASSRSASSSARASPTAPKVGSGGSLSPRGDWRAPSDSEATVWLEELRANVPVVCG